MDDLGAVALGEACGDQRAVTGGRVALDAQQSGAAPARQRAHECAQIRSVEDLGEIATCVLRRQQLPVALADACYRVLAVLELAELGRRRELATVLIVDARLRQRRLQAQRVRPRVLRAPNAATLSNVEHEADIGVAQLSQEAGGCETVDPDRGDPRSRLGGGSAQADPAGASQP
jgi:hypothetical protein